MLGECLDHADTCQTFFQSGTHETQHLLHLKPDRPDTRAEAYGQHGNGNSERQYYQSHLPVYRQYHERYAQEHKQHLYYPEQTHGKEHARGFNIDRSPGHKLSGLVLVMELETEALQSVIERISYIIGNLLRNNFAEIAVAVHRQAPEETGSHHYHRNDDAKTAFARAEDGINAVTEHAGYDNTESRREKLAGKCQRQHGPVSLDEAY
ncbi:hypothetical protein ES703_103903 [subsurface metagenome]